MAEHLASIFGTEKDRVNCPFYFKIGACRHGDRCSRLHTKPSVSPTLLLSNMYQRPDMITPGVDAQGNPIDPRRIQQHFEEFYEDLFEELRKYGEIESLNVCDNLADHMESYLCVSIGRPIIVDFSPVTDFREATCRQYEENACNRGGYCNFMHLKRIGRELRRQLFGSYPRRRSHSRSRSPYRHRSHEEHSHSGRGSRRITKVGAGGIGVQALDIGRDEVEALGGGVNEARLGKAVRRGVLKLHNGIGKGSSRKKQPKIMSMLTAATMTMGKCKMAAVKNISSTYHRSKENMHTDLL
ncbi:hypothetical protein POTOM_017941 [Populus tomentosa]|uniref:C3H1-type domain-containing protein n=1 Tax=Populus tomentosa TaxID=118781 RepID=A0A8X7ZXZ9_POPTO|nr:hypothetical protein POTOM_017941 [Populus tomentosa]